MGPRGLQDLQGLLQVLHHDPFSDGRAWSHCVSNPYLSGEPGSRSHLNCGPCRSDALLSDVQSMALHSISSRPPLHPKLY